MGSEPILQNPLPPFTAVRPPIPIDLWDSRVMVIHAQGTYHADESPLGTRSDGIQTVIGRSSG